MDFSRGALKTKSYGLCFFSEWYMGQIVHKIKTGIQYFHFRIFQALMLQQKVLQLKQSVIFLTVNMYALPFTTNNLSTIEKLKKWTLEITNWVWTVLSIFYERSFSICCCESFVCLWPEFSKLSWRKNHHRQVVSIFGPTQLPSTLTHFPNGILKQRKQAGEKWLNAKWPHSFLRSQYISHV